MTGSLLQAAKGPAEAKPPKRPRPGIVATSGPSAAAVVALQSAAGNRAVSRMMAAAKAPAGAPPVQRKVGFEFEDASWRLWKVAAAQGGGEEVRPVIRKEAVHKGPGFSLEADDSAGADTPSAEFVTVPFDETPSGIDAAEQTLISIGTVWGFMDAEKGRPGPGLNLPAPWGPAEVIKYASGTTVGFSGTPKLPANRVLLSRGSTAGEVKMQVTAGIALSSLPTAMKYFGTAQAGEAPNDAARRDPGRAAMAAPGAVREELVVLGAAPAVAATALTAFQTHFAGADAAVMANTPAFEGLLAAMMLTLKMLQLPLLNQIKYRLPLMARTSFGAMFESLPSNQRRLIRREQANLATDLVNASNAQPLLPPTGGWLPDTGLTVGSPLIRSSTQAPNPLMPLFVPQVKPDAAFGSLTIGEWVKGITKGVDYLMPGNMERYLKAHGVDKATRTGVLENAALMESFGTFKKMDKRGAGKLAVFENRAIKPTPAATIPLADAMRNAWNQLLFYAALRQSPNNPGPYPDLDVGQRPGDDA